MIICTTVERPIEMWFAPLVVVHITVLHSRKKCMKQFGRFRKKNVNCQFFNGISDCKFDTRIKYDVHGGSLHCFKYWVSTADTLGRIIIIFICPTTRHIHTLGASLYLSKLNLTFSACEYDICNAVLSMYLSHAIVSMFTFLCSISRWMLCMMILLFCPLYD